jgi:hypothetical protein
MIGDSKNFQIIEASTRVFPGVGYAGVGRYDIDEVSRQFVELQLKGLISTTG